MVRSEGCRAAFLGWVLSALRRHLTGKKEDCTPLIAVPGHNLPTDHLCRHRRRRGRVRKRCLWILMRVRARGGVGSKASPDWWPRAPRFGRCASLRVSTLTRLYPDRASIRHQCLAKAGAVLIEDLKVAWGRRPMSLQKTFVVAGLAVVLAAAGSQAPSAAEFTYNEKTNADLAKKLKIPVFFAVPKSSLGTATQGHQDHRQAGRVQAPRRPQRQGRCRACASSLPSARAFRRARQERAPADRRHHADVPVGVGRRWRLPQHPDGHLAYELRLHRQERQPAQSRQPDGRRIRRPGQLDERALSHRSTSCTSSVRGT